MPLVVTVNTKRDQVLQCIVAELAAAFQVMDLQVYWRAAILTPPSISLQDFILECLVCSRIQFQPWLLLP
jgi:hypothetical protein